MATAAPETELTTGRPIESGGAFIVCVKDAIGLSVATFYGSTPDQALQRARQFTYAPAMLSALRRCDGEMLYAAEKLPHSNAREAHRLLRAAIANAGA